jgi:hypothetical protein
VDGAVAAGKDVLVVDDLLPSADVSAGWRAGRVLVAAGSRSREDRIARRVRNLGMLVGSMRRSGARAVLLVALLAGCGGASHDMGGSRHVPRAGRPVGAALVPPAVGRHVGSASCAVLPLARVPLAQETGVYRAGPLTLVVGEDLGQQSSNVLASGSGSEAIAVLTGDRPASLMVDPRSAGRFSLQFTDPTSAWQAANGEGAVRFPACGQRIHRFMGGITFRGQGCVLLWVRPAGHMPIPMLIPIGDTLRGCPTLRSTRTLGSGAEPFLGVACHPADSIRCGHVGVGVALKAAAALVTVEIDGRLVTLTPPDPHNDLWSGYLYEADLTHGPLDIHPPAGQKLWFGEPAVTPRVRLTVYFADGRVASRGFADPLHPGFG